MPLANNGGVQIHYESSGRGPAVLLIMGLAMAATGWWRTVPVLSKSFRVLAFDNRGIGSSDSAGSYSLRELAEDAVAVLEAAGEESAHVYGISLGGMIAQELALRHPERARSLVLGATTVGGPSAPPADRATLDFFRRAASIDAEEAIWASVPYTYAKFRRPEDVARIGEDLARRLANPVDRSVYARQVGAGIGHDTSFRLDAIAVPTLVVHGEEDRVVPVKNARILAEAIPHGELKIWPGAGHLYTTDEPKADVHVARFLKRTKPRPLTERLRAALPHVG